MSEWTLGVDLSFSPTTLEWWQARHSEGYRVMSQALWTGATTPGAAYNNLLNAKRAGFVITGYTNTKFGGGRTAVSKAMAAAADLWDELYQVQVDVEIGPNHGLPLPRQEDIRWPLEELLRLGKRPIIYTASWFWRGQMGNPTWPWLADWGLWNAFYDGDPDIDFPSAPYGPWTVGHLWGEQFKGTTAIDGAQVDLNVFHENLYAPNPAPTEPAPISPIPTPEPTEKEEDMRQPRQFVSKEGAPEIYEVVTTPDGVVKLVHQLNRTVFLARYDSELDTFDNSLSWGNAVFHLPTVFPSGVPNKVLNPTAPST